MRGARGWTPLQALLLRLFDQDLFLLEACVVGFGKRIQRSRFAFLDCDDDVRLAGPARVIEIVARRRGGMIRMRVIVPDDAEASSACVIVSAFVLLRRNQVSSFTGLLPFVLSRKCFIENVRFAIANAKQKAAAFVRIS